MGHRWCKASTNSPGRGHRPDAHLRPAASANGPSRLRGPLQRAAPHRSCQLRPPRPDHPVADLSRERIQRRPVLGGLINEYERPHRSPGQHQWPSSGTPQAAQTPGESCASRQVSYLFQRAGERLAPGLRTPFIDCPAGLPARAGGPGRRGRRTRSRPSAATRPARRQVTAGRADAVGARSPRGHDRFRIGAGEPRGGMTCRFAATQNQHNSGFRGRSTRGQHGQNGTIRHSTARLLK